MDVEAEDGTQFWSSKSFTVDLGSNKKATVTFDGTFDNDGDPMKAVIYDGKIEVQTWWDYSEKKEEDLEDTLTMTITNIKVVYSVPDVMQGDVNGDGAFTVADVVLLQKWLLAVPDAKLANWKAADLSKDNKVNVVDLGVMKRELLNE